MRLERENLSLKFCEMGKVVWSKNFALNNREVYLDLVEPTGMDGRMNQNGVRIPLAKPLDGAFSTMRGAVIRNPKHPACRGIRFPSHHMIDQVMKRVDPVARPAKAKDLGPMHIPSGKIRQGASPFVLMFDSARMAWAGGCGGHKSFAGLNTGFFISADDVVVLAQRLAFPSSLVQIQDPSRLSFKVRVTRPDPTSITPGPNGIGGKPAPYSCSADRGNYSARHGFSGDFFACQVRERQAKVPGQLAGQRFDLDHNLRGEKGAGDRALPAPRALPNVPRRSVCATWQRFAVVNRAVVQCSYCPSRRKQGGQLWRA